MLLDKGEVDYDIAPRRGELSVFAQCFGISASGVITASLVFGRDWADYWPELLISMFVGAIGIRLWKAL
jgi:hypothetical protein